MLLNNYATVIFYEQGCCKSKLERKQDQLRLHDRKNKKFLTKKNRATVTKF